MVQGIAYGILHVYNALIDDPVTCRHRSRTGALLLLRQVVGARFVYWHTSSDPNWRSLSCQLRGRIPDF
jgi:hypothetical protein